VDFYQWTALAVILALAAGGWQLLKALLRRVPPFAAPVTDEGSATWNAEYRSDWRRGLGDGLLAAAAMTVVSAIALAVLAAAAAPASEVRLAPSGLLWLLPAALLAWPVGQLVWQRRRAHLLAPERLRDVLTARERHQRLRPRPLGWLTGGLALAAGGFTAVLLAGWQLQVESDGLTWSPLWSLQEREYSYADVRSVAALQSRRAWHGEIVRSPAYRIELADGRAWESWRMSHGKTPAELEQVMRLIAQRAGRPLEALDPYPRGLPADAPRAARNTAPSS